MKNPSIIGNLEPQTRIYRIFPRVRFFELFKEQRNALVQPRKWQDPFENIFRICLAGWFLDARDPILWTCTFLGDLA